MASAKLMSSGCVLYQGPSRLTGEPIVAILTFESKNEKTGPMAQSWILADDLSPTDAIKAGADDRICGDCFHRGPRADGRSRSCYVNVYNAPLVIWKAWRDGRYPAATDAVLRAGLDGKALRIGSYGDPVAVPIRYWNRALRFATGHAGYSHQWREHRHLAYRTLLMASVETESDRELAHSYGWRTFRTRLPGTPILPGEIACPASAEGQYRRTCDTCRACDGFHRAGQTDITTLAHGAPWTLHSYRKNLRSQPETTR